MNTVDFKKNIYCSQINKRIFIVHIKIINDKKFDFMIHNSESHLNNKAKGNKLQTKSLIYLQAISFSGVTSLAK